MTWNHEINWGNSPFGPYCWHSFRTTYAKYGEVEVTAEPYLYGSKSDGPLGSWTIKLFRNGSHFATHQWPDLIAREALEALSWILCDKQIVGI